MGAIALVSGAHAATGPCDIYLAGGTPCVAAHSTIRALYGNYSGNLYQVKRGSDSTTKDIGVLTPGGFANAPAQDQFCVGTTCTISILYDQSGKGNHLTAAPGGGARPEKDLRVIATASKLSVSGNNVYAMKFTGRMGYRNNKTNGIAKADDPESMYMVTSGTYYNDLCCFDYGNAETTNLDDGAGTMEAIYFGNQHALWGWGNMTPNPRGGVGPWVEADLENGLFAGNAMREYKANTAVPYAYVTAMLKGKAGTFALKGGDATSGALKTMHEGSRPSGTDGRWAWNPMRKQGAIILGIGGDNSNWSQGIFYEGCMTTGYSTAATDSAIQANIVAAKYGSTTNLNADGRIRESSTSLRYDPSTAISVLDYTLESPQAIRLRVLDLQGREVARLVDGTATAGHHQLIWDAKQAHSGLYVVTMDIDGRLAWTGRVIIGR